MKNKKTLIALFLLIIIGLVGLTLAYFTGTFGFTNKYRTKWYKTTVTENFKSPDNWTPGTNTKKEIFAVNEGSMDVAVRMSYEEKWTPYNSNYTLGLFQKQIINGEEVDVRAAEIILADDFNDKWIVKNENGKTYYYYKTKVMGGSKSSSFLKSVRFNPLIEASSNCIETNINDNDKKIGVKEKCESTGVGYDGATYTLTITVETAQYEYYKEIWNTDVEIN